MKGVAKAILSVLLVCIQYGPSGGYKAAVYEYATLTKDINLDRVRRNIQEYANYADSAKSQSVDILVFPEYGLTGLNASRYPEEYAVDLTDTSSDSILKRLQNLVAERQVYLVVNLLEKVQESNKATKYYNTNLVFRRNGTIILKYRKINLYNEDRLTPGASNQSLTFTTDFGVTFSIFTGFDILFDNPSRRVLKNSDVTDIVYPTAWYSTMPFFTSLTVQQGYALANGVNLLAANYGYPKEGLGGSGIYLPDGKAAEIYISDSVSTKPIVQEVPKIESRPDRTVCAGIAPYGLPSNTNRSNVANYMTKKNFDASDYKFKKVDLSQRNSLIDLCDGSFCCTFDIIVDSESTRSSDIYKVVAFDGVVEEDSTNYHLRICSLLACENDSNDSCGNKLESTNTKFTKVTVNGNVKNENGTFYVPLTLDSHLLPLQNIYYCKNNNGTSSSYVELTSTKAPENLLVFGFLGKTVSAATSVHAFGLFFMTLFVIVKSVVF